LYFGGAVASNSTQTPEGDMSEPVPRNAILASSSITRPGEIDRLNAILEKANLGRPLGSPEHITPEVVVLPVATDPQAVAAALSEIPEGGGHHAEVPSSYAVHTVEDGATEDKNLIATQPFTASGVKTGHGLVSWELVRRRAMPPKPRRLPTSSSPVVVELDSGVKPHPWFPSNAHPSFWFEPDPPPSFILPRPDPALKTGDFGAYWGHATFLAGLIRLHAPAARVMSVQLMNDAGKIDDHAIISALGWLLKYIEKGGVVDVVLMAFGRPKKQGEANPHHLTKLINKLGHQHGVKFVASAGNHHSRTENIPACLAAHPQSPVVSVGAGISAEDREWYSNYGPWVHKWRPGAVVSVMPLTAPDKKGEGYALWSGTSFSAAILAGELAQKRAAERAAKAGS
jgi:hypothetical protein